LPSLTPFAVKELSIQRICLGELGKGLNNITTPDRAKLHTVAAIDIEDVALLYAVTNTYPMNIG